jgi:hypothetical protein
MIIGISGNRCVGKDTFYKFLFTLDRRFKRYAFADSLKQDLDPLFKNQFNIDIFNIEAKEKEIIRPIMISYGVAWRNIDVNHWVKNVYNNIQKECDYTIPVITDLRYKNELEFLREKYGNKLIHINITRKGSISPTEEELNNLKYISNKADVQIEWGFNTDEEMLTIVKNVHDNYIIQLKNELL